jgi:hypothetical protein
MSQEVNMKLNVDSKGAVKNVDAVNDSLKETSQKSKEATTDVSEMGNQLDILTGGAVSGFKKLKGTLSNVTKGFRTLKGVLLTSGIGAIAIAIGAVAQAFSDSEEGQNKFAKIMGVLGSVLGNLTDKLSDLGMGIIETFTNPVEAFKNFSKSINDFVVKKIDQLLGGLGLLGSAFQKLFDGDFKGALNDAGTGFLEINRAINPAVIATEALVDGIKKTIEATKELGKEIAADAKSAQKVADLRAKADKAERALIVDRAKADRDRAALLEQAIDKENFTTQQRIGFLQEAAALEEKITNQEIEAARLRSEAKTLENTLSKSTKEDMIEEEELKAALIQLETAKLTKAKEVTGQIIALKAEEAAAIKAIADKEAADNKARDDKAAADKKVREDQAAKDKEISDKAQEDRNARIANEEQRQIDMISAAKHAAADQAIALFGAETAAGKAALVAKQVMNAIEMVEEAKKTITFSSLVAARSSAAVAEGSIQTAKVGFPQNIPMLIAYGLQAAGIMMSIKSAISGAKSAAGSAGGGGVSAPASRTPSFNIVGSSAQNQIAEALNGQNQRPIKAFVTSSDVSSAQALDRNIIETAKIG